MPDRAECCQQAYRKGFDEGLKAGKEITDTLENDIGIVRELVEERQELDLHEHWCRYAAGAINAIAMTAMLEGSHGNNASMAINDVGKIVCESADWMLAAEKQRFEKEKDSEV